MKFKRNMELERGLKQIEIAPLIDTVFLLLIFFLLTSNFVLQPGIKVDLPRVLTGKALAVRNVELMVSGQDMVYFDGKAITAEELGKLINQAAQRKQAVLLKADRQASLGRIAEIWDSCRNAGVTQVSIATNQQ